MADIAFKKKPNTFWLVGLPRETNTLLDVRHINYSCEIFFCFIPLSKPQCIAKKLKCDIERKKSNSNMILSINSVRVSKEV